MTFLRKLRKKQLSYTLTEKVDGAAISFGVDEKGFYTSREAKGGIRYYSETDYPRDQFWAVPFRSAHIALMNIIDLRVGVHINAEILFGKQPNTVPYDNDDPQIVILNAIGKVDLNELDGLETRIVLHDIPDTTTGRKITTIKSETHHWRIRRVPQIDKAKLEAVVTSSVFVESIDTLYWFLRQPNGIFPTLTNNKIFNIKLNKKPEGFSEWKEIKEVIREEREEITNRIMEFKLAIKELFLDRLVRNVASEFGSEWIEGVVLQYDEEFVKFVDRDFFWELNSANYTERNKIAGKGDTLKNRVRDSMASAANLPKINKRYIESMGCSRSERVANISAPLQHIRIKNLWNEILNNGILELEGKLVIYESTQCLGNQDNKRTLMVYAQTFDYLENLKLSISKTSNSGGLVESWLADKLDL